MTALIKGGVISEINHSQTQILFDGDWYDILEDMDGDNIFMYDGKAIYFSILN